MRARKASRQRALRKQRVRRKRRTRLWAVTARIVGSAFLKIAVLLVSVALLSLIFVYCYHFVLTSPFFALQKLKITGLDSDEQRRLVKLWGLKKGQNLVALKLNDLRKKIEADPWIRSARVERQLPDTLVVSVEKEQPLAIVVAERLYYMNRWGEIFEEVGGQEYFDLPLVTGLSDLGSEAGEELREVAAVLKMLSREDGLIGVENLSEIHINDMRHFSLYFKGIPAEIQMGATAVAVQIAKLRKLVGHLMSTGRIKEADRIDLEYAGGAVVSFRKG